MNQFDSFLHDFQYQPSVSSRHIEEEILSCQRFLTSVSTYLGRPNLLNTNCFGTSITQLTVEYHEGQIAQETRDEVDQKLHYLLAHSLAGELGFIKENQVKALTVHRELIIKSESEVLKDKNYVEIWDFDSWKIQMIPKSILEKGPNAPTNKLLPPVALIFEFKDGKMKISVVGDLMKNEASVSFYFSKLFPKLFMWAKVEDEKGPKKGNNEDSLIPKSSLLCIDLLFYTNNYKEIKTKYASAIKSIWSGSTNPEKFIHEDIAIAAYLITFWHKESQVPNFVDLGCGNGLLTFFLTAEGFKGFGLDVRKREIWDKYPIQLDLRVEAIDPALEYQEKFNCDENTWYIGNHPDELTPWIPILARKTKSNFFIIPCCSFDFTGKFNRGIKGKNFGSQYQCYLHYLKHISDKSGYYCQFDKLRIPSTKRVCILGMRKKEFNEELGELNESLEIIISEGRERNLLQNCRSKPSTNPKPFEPRAPKEEVRNCSQIDRQIINSIVLRIFQRILSGQVNLIRGEGYAKDWNAGVEINLSDCLPLLTLEEKSLLKRQHSGFQTLLRNNGHVFHCNNGKIRIKPPSLEKYRELKQRHGVDWRKTNPCFFHANHPYGCPLVENYCCYLHL